MCPFFFESVLASTPVFSMSLPPISSQRTDKAYVDLVKKYQCIGAEALESGKSSPSVSEKLLKDKC